MKTTGRGILFISLCFFLLLGTMITGANAKTIVLKAITVFPMDHPINKYNKPYIDEINKRAKGELRIKYLGGPEVVATFDQAEAIRTGMIDIDLFVPLGYLESYMAVANCEGLSQLTVAQERASEAYNLWVEVFAKSLNARYLGQRDKGAPFALFTNKPVNKLSDLKGMGIRAMPLYEAALAALGASTMTTPMDDLYTAMERGVVDGYMAARPIPPGFALQEVTKYIIEPSFFQMEGARFMNLDKWNSLPKHLQDMILEVTAEYEIIGETYCLEQDKKALKVYEAAGVKTLRLPSEDAEKFLDILYGRTWETIIKKDPEYGPKFKKALSK